MRGGRGTGEREERRREEGVRVRKAATVARRRWVVGAFSGSCRDSHKASDALPSAGACGAFRIG